MKLILYKACNNKFYFQAWYGEHIDFPNSNRYQNTPKKTGHYTALIWATTRYIGCGRSRYIKYDETHKVQAFVFVFLVFSCIKLT